MNLFLLILVKRFVFNFWQKSIECITFIICRFPKTQIKLLIKHPFVSPTTYFSEIFPSWLLFAQFVKFICIQVTSELFFNTFFSRKLRYMWDLTLSRAFSCSLLEVDLLEPPIHLGIIIYRFLFYSHSHRIWYIVKLVAKT